MPDFKSTFTDEVRRLAKKEAKALNETITAQGKTIKALTKRIAELEKKLEASAPAPAKDATPVDQPADAKESKARFSPKRIIKFRKKYGISQKAFAALVGVTVFTVSHWEIGKSRPRPNQVAAISALAKRGKREIEAILAEKAPEEFAAIKAKNNKKAAKGKAVKPAVSSDAK